MVQTLVWYRHIKLEITMKIRELLSEASPMGKIRKDHEESHQGIWKMRDVGGYDRTYHLNRIMMAAAMSDGTMDTIDMDSASWMEKYNTAYPYTELENEMIKAAVGTIPTDGAQVLKYGKSKEAPGANTVSPVAKRKPNKYGV
jgi:hypothetical protein